MLEVRPESLVFDVARPESICKSFKANARELEVLLFRGFLAAPLALQRYLKLLFLTG